MAKYIVIYKCRLCGEDIEDGTTGNHLARIITMSMALQHNHHTQHRERYISIGIEPELFGTHQCADGSYGLTDFQGFRKNGEDE